MTSPLIRVDELATLLAGATPPVLLDVRWYLTEPDRGEREYLEGHLPGAVFVPMEHDLAAPAADDRVGGRHPLPEPAVFEAALRRAGVNDDSRVVVYDQGSSLGAGRAWWMLRDAGLDDVRVLNGGFAGWRAAGNPVDDVVSEPAAGTVTVRAGQRQSVDADAVQAHLAAGGRVIDVRAAERYRGDVEPMDPVAGHIPGAINRPATELQRDGRFLPADELADRLSGLAEGDVVQCGSGITAAQVLLAAEQAGITGLRLYPGSWSDWVSDPERPVATGD